MADFYRFRDREEIVKSFCATDNLRQPHRRLELFELQGYVLAVDSSASAEESNKNRTCVLTQVFIRFEHLINQVNDRFGRDIGQSLPKLLELLFSAFNVSLLQLPELFCGYSGSEYHCNESPLRLFAAHDGPGISKGGGDLRREGFGRYSFKADFRPTNNSTFFMSASFPVFFDNKELNLDLNDG